jgi:hypothetical protein
MSDNEVIVTVEPELLDLKSTSDAQQRRRHRAVCDQPRGRPGRPAGGRHRGVATTAALVFGGVCDRCGRLYLQRCFPHGCLCPSCVLGGSTTAVSGQLLGRTHITGVNLAAS